MKISEDSQGIQLRITKIDADRRLVTAITNVVTDGFGNNVIDRDDDVIGIDNLEDAFIKAFSQGGGEGAGGEMHEVDGGADVVQHFTFSTDTWKSLGDSLREGFQHVPDLSHMPELGLVTFFVTDDNLWASVKGGHLPDVSIEGKGHRSHIDA